MTNRILARLGCILLLGWASAFAEDPAPDATVEFSTGSPVAGVGYRWGAGTLYYRGGSHPFLVDGLTAAGGYVPVTATGAVYHLSSLEEFEGFYSERDLMSGRDEGVLENDRGVVIHLHPQPEGEHIQLSLLGVHVLLERRAP